MGPVPLETNRRLWVLFEAGDGQYAIEATAVLEVATPDKEGDTVGSHRALSDLSRLLGGADEVRPGAALVLDSSPTLALRVKRVVEVVDETQARGLSLPARASKLLAPVVRRALLVGSRICLVLDVDAVAQGLTRLERSPLRRDLLVNAREALVVEIGSDTWGIPLDLVHQVVPTTGPSAIVPRDTRLGRLLWHDHQLWPIFTATPGAPETLAVLLDFHGDAVAVVVSRALGVRREAMLKNVPALDLENLFS